LEAYRVLGEGKNAASLKQIRAALSFACKHWELKNPFAKIGGSLHIPAKRFNPVFRVDSRMTLYHF
jgi:hypothetical protein